MERPGASAVESMIASVVRTGMVTVISTSCIGQEERWWFGSRHARQRWLAPLRVVKELNGRATDVSPSGRRDAKVRFCSRTAPSWRISPPWSGDGALRAPTDRVKLHKVLEAIYKSAKKKEIRL